MSLRARLILAFFLLAVVPLTGVSVYSYVSSQRAYRRAVEAEAGSLAEEMRAGMGAVERDLGLRLARLGDLPLAGELAQPQTPEAQELLRARLEREMGGASALLESLEFTPGVPSPAAPAGRAAPAVPVPAPPVPPKEFVFKFSDPTKDPEFQREMERIQRQVRQATRDAQRAQADVKRAATQRRENDAAAQARRDEQRRREEEVARGGGQARGPDRNGHDKSFRMVLRRGGEALGTLRAHVRERSLLSTVLAGTRVRPGDLVFAVDRDGTLHASDEDRGALAGIGVDPKALAGADVHTREGWIIVTRRDPDSSLVMGVARPVGQGLSEIRRTAIRNLGYGLGMVVVALLGILPLSRRMTRELGTLTQGAERLAQGDLSARVPVRSTDEIGRLAATFNRMAEELRTNQERLLAQERLRKELEMGRRIQEEMLPHEALRLGFAEVKGVSIPAREVGGDFFNYFTLPGGDGALLVGDVSGKGVAAALLMANLQATLRARLRLEPGLVELATSLDQEIGVSSPAYLTLFLAVIDGHEHDMRYVNAGHNAPFLLRADGGVLALESTGRPLGLLPGGGYEEGRVRLGDGDCLFLYTDGVVETEDDAGEAFGAERLQALVRQERASGLDGILARVEEAVRAYRGGAEAADDATIVVLRVGPTLGPLSA